MQSDRRSRAKIFAVLSCSLVLRRCCFFVAFFSVSDGKIDGFGELCKLETLALGDEFLVLQVFEMADWQDMIFMVSYVRFTGLMLFFCKICYS